MESPDPAPDPAPVPLTYYCDSQRHLVCTPYSTENLHRMAEELGIKRCKCRYGRSHTCCDCRSEKRRSEESKHKSQGLCFCGKPRAKDSVQCRQHKDMNTWYYRLSVSDPARVERWQQEPATVLSS